MMSDSPFFSIITPTFNRDYCIPEAISCVKAQTFKNFEFIIVDDGSTDDTDQVITNAALTEPRIVYLKQNNEGRSSARNLGIENSKGQFVCFLDSDDAWSSNYLSNLYDAIEVSRCSFLITQMVWKLETGQQVERPVKGFSSSEMHLIIEQEIGMNACVRKTLFDNYLFNPGLEINEDYELWLRIICHYSIDTLEVTGSKYLVTTTSEHNNLKYRDVEEVIKTQKLILAQTCIKTSTPPRFWSMRTKDLRLNLIRAAEQENRMSLCGWLIVLFLLRYPFEKVNASLFVSLVYSIPGGQLLKKAVAKIKNL